MPVKKPNHYLGLLLLAACTTVAAADTEDAVVTCARISSTGDRILCLEDALRRLSPAEAEPAATASLPDIDDEVLTATEASAENEVIEVTGEVGIETAPEAVEPEPAVAASEPPPAAAVATATATSVELGAEQVAELRGEEVEQIRISANIVSHELVGSGRLRLTLDNGQVWQQTGDDDDRIARKIRGEDNLAVEMWQSRSGGYRMFLVEIDRTLRVRRIR